jgi:hypothetical protein
MVLAGLGIALVYTLLGIRRLAHGAGIVIFAGDAILRYLSVSSLNYSAYGFRFGLLPLSNPWLGAGAKASFFLFTLAEISAPLALFYPRFRRLWLPVILALHVGTLLLMNIFFWEQMILVLIFMTPLAHTLAVRIRRPGAPLRIDPHPGRWFSRRGKSVTRPSRDIPSSGQAE